MLLTTPVEIQAKIVSYLDHSSLAQLARVSHHVHLLAIPPLYRTVTLHTWADLSTFFTLSQTHLRKVQRDRVLPSERADRRRADLDCICRLVLDFPVQWPDHNPYFPIAFSKPHALLSLSERPLQLDLLRVAYMDNLQPIVAFLKVVNPRELQLQRCSSGYVNDAEFNVFLNLGPRYWMNLTKFTYGAREVREYAAPVGKRSIKDTPFASVKDVVFRFRDGLGSVRPSLKTLLPFCPGAETLSLEIQEEKYHEEIELGFDATDAKAAEAEAEAERIVPGRIAWEVVVAPGVKVRVDRDGWNARTIWPEEGNHA